MYIGYCPLSKMTVEELEAAKEYITSRIVSRSLLYPTLRSSLPRNLEKVCGSVWTTASWILSPRSIVDTKDTHTRQRSSRPYLIGPDLNKLETKSCRASLGSKRNSSRSSLEPSSRCKILLDYHRAMNQNQGLPVR